MVWVVDHLVVIIPLLARGRDRLETIGYHYSLSL